MISEGGAVTLSLFVFVGMLVCLEIGFRAARRRAGGKGELPDEGSGVIEAAIFGLLGLLLAFSFGGAEARLEFKRQLVVLETNAIGTAYLRVDLLPSNEQPEIRRLFREYLDARLQFFENLADLKAGARASEVVSHKQREIWDKAVEASRSDPSQNVGRLLLPALNEMIDVTTTRGVSLHTHLPPLLLALLICIALLSAVLAGYDMIKGKQRNWLHGLIYAAVISVTIYSVLDLDSPRSGLIRLDVADAELQKLRNSIQQIP